MNLSALHYQTVANDEELAELAASNLCPLECCNFNAPDPTRIDVDNKSSFLLGCTERGKVTSRTNGFRSSTGWFSAKPV